MKILMNNVFQASRSTGLRLVLVASLALSVAACSEDEVGDGTIVNSVLPPLDFALDLPCADAGLADEICILEDPNNPYARSAISESSTDEYFKFNLYNVSPSKKNSFYIWATAQARNPGGENQFYTALSLHEMYTLGGVNADADAKSQAIRAYRSVLDNYFDSVTFSAPDAAGNQITYPLKDWAGDRLYNPAALSLAPLFDSQTDALNSLDQWGYTYDASTKVVTKK